MTVSKRLRYEVLRRDNHTCRYCGASAPEATLTVDHVLPVALGGGDSSGNLVAACQDCNAGKTSTNPDARVVDDVNEDAIRWSRAMQTVLDRRAEDRAGRRQNHIAFRDMWDSWTYGNGETFELPADWRTTIDKHIDRGLDLYDFEELVAVAMSARSKDPWKYFNGCCWRRLESIQEEVAAEVSADPSQPDVDFTRDAWDVWAEMAERRAEQLGVSVDDIISLSRCPHSQVQECGQPLCVAIAAGVILGRIRSTNDPEGAL